MPDIPIPVLLLVASFYFLLFGFFFRLGMSACDGFGDLLADFIDWIFKRK